jgi:hypothetical protein
MDEKRADGADFRITLISDHDSMASGMRQQYRTVAAGPDGQEVHGWFMNPLEPWEVDAAESSITAAGRGLQRSTPTNSLDPVRDLGARLYDALFHGSIERAFLRTMSAEGFARVRLELDDPDTLAIPWEFLYDRRRNDFLVLSTRTPLIRSRGHIRQRSELTLEAPVRVLAVASDVTGTWKVDDEMDILREELTTTRHVELTTRDAVTWKDFREAVEAVQPHVVHLIATGSSGGQTVAFRTDVNPPLTREGLSSTHEATALGELVSKDPDLRLLVINGCRTDSVAAAVARYLPAVVGHRGDISDVGALAFTGGVYRGLTRGLSLDAAVTAARLEVDSASPGGREWCAPVLYQRTASVTFPVAVGAALQTAQATIVAPPQDATASHDDRILRKLRSLLAIHQSNLDALGERSGRFGDSPPAYLTQERNATQEEIANLREQIATVEQGRP